ncbi:cytochrome b-c1 complex subunit 6, mitochondrial-like [Stylophora pistillata]|uniref:Cytochrome b-c1 complex subunit 6, mitochondrial n=1 Tax=Stylophora pistillata TaxID=50429 RepID=A0A2B4SXR9_STYPI|nr:cytochrome b-c1 complex subunit 6, mitochondrial-like [Stylophora pistillata]PFX33979.1 Cytochrome b-c1 complex subunit 6, mitochondrial [Stylophora pistillata]
MGLDEEKALLGSTIVSEKVEDSDPEDEGEEVEEPAGDAGGDDDDDEDEEELEDPRDKILERCTESPTCSKVKLELDTCNQRVSSKSSTEETCVQELFDFMECADHCVAHHLFHKLK